MNFADAVYRYVMLPPIKAVTRNDAEVAHEWFVKAMSTANRFPYIPGSTIDDPLLQQTLLDGLRFPNPFGTAAGMDKNGTIYRALAKLTGVGHIELGGVTVRPQAGNMRPRIVRVDANNLINAMGFPNNGVDALVETMSQTRKPPVPVSVQLAKKKETADEHAPGEYAQLITKFAGRDFPDYFTINVSSPNTPGLRNLQAPEMLAQILEHTTAVLDEQSRSRRRLLVKLAPDIEENLIDEVIELIERYDAGGLVLTNTTTARPVHSKHDQRAGGFSGSALYGRSAKLVKYAAARLPRNRALVAVGGIDTADRAYEMLQYADLIDGYTALILKSPLLFRSIARGVLERMVADGVQSLPELRAANRPPGAEIPN